MWLVVFTLPLPSQAKSDGMDGRFCLHSEVLSKKIRTWFCDPDTRMSFPRSSLKKITLMTRESTLRHIDISKLTIVGGEKSSGDPGDKQNGQDDEESRADHAVASTPVNVNHADRSRATPADGVNKLQ